jgi:lysophospholipase L1-like esterase
MHQDVLSFASYWSAAGRNRPRFWRRQYDEFGFGAFAMRLIPSLSTLLLLVASASAQQSITYTCGRASGHAVALSATTLFPEAANAKVDPAAFGFDLQPVPASFSGGACSSDKPFFFSVGARDGDYKVTVVLGGAQPSTDTVRAESRRLMIFEKKVAAGASASETFVVNVRLPAIAGQDTSVRLKPREIGALDWDNKLTLEFNGEHPSVRSITIEPVTNVPTVYIAGDSTVVDQDKEPWAAWGQMLPVFMTSRVAIANEAESGETIKSFVGERRYAKIMSTMKKGDYLMVQFAHNDQKPGAGFVPIPEYKELMKKFIDDARAKGAKTILVTAMNRRKFDDNGKIEQTLGDYPQATRDVATEEHVGLIDLNAMSKTLFEAMGPDGTLKAFVHFPANSFPGQTTELKDDTHFNPYGAYELAECVVESIRKQHLPLEQYLRKGIPAFDPAHPDPVAQWHLPASPAISTETPYGR